MSAHPYDHIAPVYDTLFTDPASLAENGHILSRLVERASAGPLLDIGCGTGLLLDYLQPVQYTGIDPASGMLSRLRAKHPAYAACVQPLPFERFQGGGYQTLVALFGAASYIAPAAWARLPRLLAPGGRYFLMFYAPGYVPQTYRKTGVVVPHTAQAGLQAVPGRRTACGPFVCVEGRR